MGAKADSNSNKEKNKERNKMLNLKALKINFEFPRDLDNHNRDCVAYVIQKYPRRVVKCTVLTRVSLESWYNEQEKKFNKERHVLLVGSVSIIGEIYGLSPTDSDSNTDKDAEGNNDAPDHFDARPWGGKAN